MRAGGPCLGHVKCRESGTRCRLHVGFCPGGNRSTCSECEHQGPAAAVTKHHRQLKPRNNRPQSWRQQRFLLSLCRWLANRVFSMSSHGRPSACVCFPISSYKVTTRVGLRSIRMTSFQLHPLFKDSLSKYELRPWGLELEHTNLGER